jgi:hypothetical protein
VIRGLLAKLWGSKVARVPFGAISGLPLGSPRKNSHLDVASVESCRVYYKGEGGGFPQVRAVVSLVCLCCPWLVLAPRVLQLCTNHFVWVVCRHVWVSEACQLFLVPSRSSNTPLYPLKCYELESVLQLLLLPLLSTWAHIWVFWGVGSASEPSSYMQRKRRLVQKSFETSKGRSNFQPPWSLVSIAIHKTLRLVTNVQYQLAFVSDDKSFNSCLALAFKI